MSHPTAAEADLMDGLRLPPFGLDDEAMTWVAATLGRLTLKQKLAQLLNVPLHGDDPADARRVAALQAGGVTRFVGEDLEAAWHATRAVLEAAHVPPLVSGDLEGGAIAVPFGTQLPNQLGLAAAADPVLSAEAVAVLAAEARALGYNWTFSPVVDINAAFRSAIVATRSYGTDLETVLAQARVNVRTFQAHGIAATAKHWPGEGFDDRDQHLVTTLNPLEPAAWEASFGRLYRTLIDDGVLAVMAGHIAWPAYARLHGAQGLEACRPASVSALLNQRLLRRELGFNGVLVSDASGMAGLGSWDEHARLVPEVIAHGCDMLLFPRGFDADIALLLRALDDGRLTERRVEEALVRVLGLKAALGLHRLSLDERLPPLEQARRVVRAPAHQQVEQRAASASVTLVKDVHATLPLCPRLHHRVVLVTEPERLGFAFQKPLPLHIPQLLAQHGFEVRAYDPEQSPTPADTDLVLYLMAQESLLLRSHIYMDWTRLHGSFRGAMRRHWHELPCVLVSMGHPYYLYDAPRMPCVINAYTAIEPVQQAVVRKLLGAEPFTAASPVDATCGLPDAPH